MTQEKLDRAGRSPLHYAALENNVEAATNLLAAGADPSLADRKGLTPLHFAAQEGSIDVARVLLKHGADVNKPDDYGNPPLWTAVFNSKGRGEMILLLREGGADPLKTNNRGYTPASAARSIGNYDVAQFFEDVSESDSTTIKP